MKSRRRTKALDGSISASRRDIPTVIEVLTAASTGLSKKAVRLRSEIERFITAIKAA